jgi:hypothetical protein
MQEPTAAGVLMRGRSKCQCIWINIFTGKVSELLKAQGAVNAFAGIALPNEGSVKLHEAMGFEKIGHFNDIGYKHDKWWDVGWWQLKLQHVEKPEAMKKPSSI